MDSMTEKVMRKILLLADYLEFLGENRFKVIAYRRAVRSMESSGRDIVELYHSGELESLPGIGDAVSKKVREIIETDKLRKLDEVRKKLPKAVQTLIEKLPVSGKKVRCLVDNGIDSMENLKEAVQSGKIEHIYGLGRASIEKIKQFFEQQKL